MNAQKKAPSRGFFAAYAAVNNYRFSTIFKLLNYLSLVPTRCVGMQKVNFLREPGMWSLIIAFNIYNNPRSSKTSSAHKDAITFTDLSPKQNCSELVTKNKPFIF
jgi:hypothetical protein